MKLRMWTSFAAALAVLAGQPSLAATARPAPKPAAKPAAKAVKKPTAIRAAAPVATGPKALSVVAGRPFEPVPASGAAKLTMTLCPEETEPATFTIKHSQPLKGVRIVASADLVGPGRIERKNIEVSRLDGLNLINQVSTSSGAVFTEADLGPSPLQFWVTVTAPGRTPPGTYKGTVAVYYQNKVFDTIPIEARVLKLRLLGSSKQYALYTSCGREMSGEDFAKLLGAFQRMGLKVVSLSAEPARFGEAVNAYRCAGMSGPTPVLTYALSTAVPTVDEVRSLVSAFGAGGTRSLLFFGFDQPSDADQISAAQAQLEVFRQAKLRTVIRVSNEIALETLRPYLDGVDYSVQMPYVQSLIKGESVRVSSKWEWYWWNARESVADNRIYAGIALWRSGLDGCTPAWTPEEGKAPADSASSLLGEALREGIDDTRYITSYMKALRELKDLKREKDKDYIATTETYLANFMRRPLEQITPAILADFRARMADYAMKLESML